MTQRAIQCLALYGILAVPGWAASSADVVESLELPNAGFENGLIGWQVREDVPMSMAHPEAAHSGELGLRIMDRSAKAGSSIATPRMPVEPGKSYRVHTQARRVSGGGVAIYLRFFDKSGRQLNPWPKAQDNLSISSGKWRDYSLAATPPADTASVDAWFRAFTGATSVVDFDDVRLEAFVPVVAPPWEPRYKLSADDPRLTAADVPGPDGLVYPDWRQAGVAGGIPEIATVIGPERFAGQQGKDVAPLINAALAEAAKLGGGAVELPEGDFHLDSPVVIRHSNVVLRGAGRERTRLIYQEHIPRGEIRMRCWTPSGVIGPHSSVEFQANPKDLEFMQVRSGDVIVRQRQRQTHWGNRFRIRLRGRDVLEKLGPGKHMVEVEFGYANGDRFKDSYEIAVSAEEQAGDTWFDQYGAVMILGRGPTGPEVRLKSTARRGDHQLSLASADHGLKTGDRLFILAPATPRWNAITGNQCPWGTYRTNMLEVTGVDGSDITVAQPFRIDFPVEDGSYVQRIEVTEQSGVEGLTIEQKVMTTKLVGPRNPSTLWYPMEDLWANGLTSCYSWNCWFRDVKVVNSGRNPIYITRSKFCEVRDAEADRAIFKGGGGTGYVGFERSFDCLMENIRTRGMRHAPNIQWGASGNVVRNGHFIGSDGQWHAGWTHENLFENNRIVQTAADLGQGTYGHGFYATGPNDVAHGPQGPRNVVYYNEVTAPKNGIHMGGGNEAWLILYNRFVSEKGRAVYGGEKSFDHIILGNVFALLDPPQPSILFNRADCTGTDIVDNRFYGPIRELAAFRAGLGRFGRLTGNQVLPLPTGGVADVPRPNPVVKSIFEWQRSEAAQPVLQGQKLSRHTITQPQPPTPTQIP